MTGGLLGIVVPLLLYVGAVLGVGLLATRRVGSSPEQYFLAGRRLGTFVLFMALFGTNATAFVFVGVPGRAYHDGIGVFSINAPIVALCTPLTFFLIGAPARRMARRLGAITPAELYAARFGSKTLGLLLFVAFTVYTLPYMVSAVVGAAVTLTAMTGGRIPEWSGGLGIVLLALLYTSLGGMRATAWTNVLQGVCFLGFLLLAFVLIPWDMGGFERAMLAVQAHDAKLLELPREGLFAARQWISWSLLISLTVIAFPHMLVRLMSATNERAIAQVCRIYPIALVLLWLPPVMIGVWGAAEFPDLAGRESDQILQLMVARHLPAALAAFGFIAVLAAVMSSLDAMVLTLSSMLVRDSGVRRWRGQGSAARQVVAGRLFSLLVAAAAYGLSQVWGRSVFEIAAVAFAGFVTLTPTLFLGVRWRGFTARAAVGSILIGNTVLFLGQFGWIPLFGFLPVFWAFLAASASALLLVRIGPPASAALTTRAFGERPTA